MIRHIVVHARHPTLCAAFQWNCILYPPRKEWDGAHELLGRISTVRFCPINNWTQRVNLYFAHANVRDRCFELSATVFFLAGS